MDWLKLLQILALICIGLLLAEASIWLALKIDFNFWLTPVSVLVVYLSVLSGLFFGQDKAWVQNVARFLYQLLLSSKMKAVIVIVICGVASAFLGFRLGHVWSVTQKEPNFVVSVFEKNPGNRISNASIGLFDMLSESVEEKKTNPNGLASFKVEAGRIWQISITINREGRLAETTLPPIDNRPLPINVPVDLSKLEWNYRDTGTPTPPNRSIFAVIKTEDVAQVKKVADSPQNTYGDARFEAEHLPWGRPKADIVIYHRAFVIGYDPLRRILRWSAYRIDTSQKLPRRNIDHSSDPLLPREMQASSDDYRGSGYDRGNLVARSDVGGYGQQADAETYYFSNIAPQTPELNQKTWVRIETYARSLTENGNKVWIIAGPAFIPNAGDSVVRYPEIGKSKVAVPTHFFRIIVRAIDVSHFETIAFLVPNQTELSQNITDYLKSIEAIESATGLEFFSNIDPSERLRLKSTSPTSLLASMIFP